MSKFRKNVAKKQRIGNRRSVSRNEVAKLPQIYPLPEYKDLVNPPPFFESGYNDPEITLTLQNPLPDSLKDRLNQFQGELINEFEAPDYQYISDKKIQFFAFEGRNLSETAELVDRLAIWFVNHGVVIESIEVEEGESVYGEETT